MDSTSVSSQDTSSNEIEFVSQSEGQLENANLSPTEVFSKQHDKLFLLQKEIDALSDNLSHQDSHACDLSHTIAQPQFMAQHNCEDLNPTDTLSKIPTCIQASSNHTLNPICAHNPMATQCNQSQYLTSLNKICAHNPSVHNPSASQDNQAKLSKSLASPCPPDPGEYVMKKSTADLGEQDLPVK